MGEYNKQEVLCFRSQQQPSAVLFPHYHISAPGMMWTRNLLIWSQTSLDDIIVASTSKEKHLSHLCLLFSLLREHRLIINSAKCLSGRSFLDFLGYHITQGGAIPLPSKMEAVQKLPQPTTVKALQEFLGMVNYNHGLIAQAAHLMQTRRDPKVHHFLVWPNAKGVCRYQGGPHWQALLDHPVPGSSVALTTLLWTMLLGPYSSN